MTPDREPYFIGEGPSGQAYIARRIPPMFMAELADPGAYNPGDIDCGDLGVVTNIHWWGGAPRFDALLLARVARETGEAINACNEATDRLIGELENEEEY